RGQGARRGDLPGVSAPLPSDHDDDDGGAARRTAARPRWRHRRRAAAAARHHDRRRLAPVSAAHALHDARGVPGLRSRGPPAPSRFDQRTATGPSDRRVTIAEPFIRRPVATTLLSCALLLAGAVAYRFLPVAALPQVEFPVIQVQAVLPGARPEPMASSVATPLERQFERIAGGSEMTASSLLGATTVILQFDLNRSIDAAARDVQAAINAARSQLPSGLVNNPTYRKVNPADAPILILALTSDSLPIGRVFDAADSVLAQKLAQVEGIGQVVVGGGAKPAVRVRVDPSLLTQLGIGLEQVRAGLRSVNANAPKGQLTDGATAWTIHATDQLFDADEYRPVIIAWQNGAPVRLGDI